MEEIGQLFFCQATAVIDHIQDNFVTIQPGLDFDMTLGWRVFDGISHQIVNDPIQLVPVGP